MIYGDADENAGFGYPMGVSVRAAMRKTMSFSGKMTRCALIGEARRGSIAVDMRPVSTKCGLNRRREPFKRMKNACNPCYTDKNGQESLSFVPDTPLQHRGSSGGISAQSKKKGEKDIVFKNASRVRPRGKGMRPAGKGMLAAR